MLGMFSAIPENSYKCFLSSRVRSKGRSTRFRFDSCNERERKMAALDKRQIAKPPPFLAAGNGMALYL